MMNSFNIMGRLTKDPELRKTESNVSVVSFSIASERDYADVNEKGEKEHKTDFFEVVAWRATAEFVSKFFTKGRMIAISGHLESRSWTDKNGNNRRNVVIVADNCYFADSKKTNDAPQNTGYGAPQNTGYGAPQNSGYGAPQNSGYGAPQNTGYPAPQNTGYGAPQNPGNAAPQNSGYGAPQNPGNAAPQNSGNAAPQNSGYSAPQNPGNAAPQNSGYSAPQNTGNATPQNDSVGNAGLNSPAPRF